MTALVIGGASCVWQDVGKALSLFAPEFTVAVNDIGVYWPGEVRYWATLHPEHMPGWIEARRKRGLPDAQHIVCPPAGEVSAEFFAKCMPNIVLSYRWPGMSASGSSGLYGNKVAIEAGHSERNVLAGIPMKEDAGHITRGKPWGQVKSFTDAWREALPRYAAKTRSMSGYTMELLGRPTPDWLK